MLRVGVDIGGTFTDVVGLEGDETLFVAKVPSTPADLIQGVRRGVARLLETSGHAAADISAFMHGTTIATNAILEQKGARLGLLATAGFEDSLEIGRQNRTRMYDLFLDAQTPVFLAPRRRRIGVTERIDARGAVVVPLDEAGVRQAVRTLVEREHVEAIAVCYLFSFVNPAHEERTRALVEECAPGLTVSLSCEVDPTFREYERTCLTAFDAYVRPVISRYLVALGRALREMGIAVDLQIMQSRGGISSSQAAVARPVTTVLSGPAAGVIGGKFAGERSGHKNLITIDIGGTSCDVALVREGKPLLSTQGRIAGYPMRVPLVDVTTIGAGGGSIAWLDSGGGLRVGPRSAGADPGPACYGKGGTDPTVTDATLLLGYLDPHFFAGGDLELRPDLAEAAVARVGRAIGKSVRETAEGIVRIIDARMADAIRLVSVQRGLDPRQFTLVAFGGAGPVHAGALARDLGISTVIVPESPGVLSAFGLLVASVEYDHARTFRARAESVDFHRAAATLAELAALGREKLERDGAPMDRVTVTGFADMRYVGQSYELEVVLPATLGPETIGLVVTDFHDLHRRIYGHSSATDPVEFVNLRSVCALAFPPPRLRPAVRGGRLADAVRATRPVVFPGGDAVPTPVYDRTRLPTGVRIPGPAIVEQADTTTVIGPGQTAQLDECQNLVIALDGSVGP
jgi:N-methylhydantoinase A/oxoprolinase/acetone carboxylase beta subunit